MKTRFSWLLVAALIPAAVLPVACADSGNSDGTSGSGASSGTSTGTAQGGNDCGFGCAGGGTNTGNLVIVPPMATIDVVDGVASPVDFNATLNGADVQPSAWVVDLSSVAGVDGTGIVTATGTVGGLVTLHAQLNGQTASALVTVNVKRTLNPGNLSQGDIDLLKTPTGGQDGQVAWLYPYDRTVFPKGLAAPELMWAGSGAGDKFWVHLKGAYTEFDVFTTADPPSRHLLDSTLWTQLTESGSGGTVDFKMNRLPNGGMAATTVIDHDWTIANGSLRGTVYYWSNNLGRVLRINPGAGAPEDFLAAAGISNNCSTCHAVSANGSTLVLGGDVDTSTFDLLQNTTAFSTLSVGKPVRNWAMPALSPDGSTLIENNAALPGPPGGSDGLWDTKTGQKLTGLGLDGVMLDMPAFAPDGTGIAYVDHSTKNLAYRPWDSVTKMVGAPTDLVPPGADGNINTVAFPSVSPDAKWVVYHRGNASSLDTRFGPGWLFLASTTQPGTEIRLRNLNADDYPLVDPNRDRGFNYEPSFAPLEAGGFSWVVFTSRRTYGNRLTGGSGAVKQLWVAAIDQNPQAGTDPSHPAFRVSGQDENLNMRGFWALEPCKQLGDGCETGSQCCNQNCVLGVCEDPDPNGCSATGNACVMTSDCCETGATCVNGFCSEPPPG